MRARTALLLLGTLAVAAACRGEEPKPRAKPVPGVVWICLDTLRADALSAGGGDGTRMPLLESFAKRATTFRDASSCASWTAPGVASLLTGLLPSRHGVQGVHTAPPLVGAVATVAEAFQAGGWWTGAWVAGGWVSAGQGFARGFERFEETFDTDGPEASVRAFEATRPEGRPFFLFLHTYAAHDPYGDKRVVTPFPPEVVAEADRVAKAVDENGGTIPEGEIARLMTAFWTDPTYRQAYGRVLGRRDWARIWADCMKWIDGGFAKDPDRAAIEARLRTAYEAGTSWCDRVVDRTLRALEALHLPEETVIAITSDHGEAFGEHGILGHGRRLDDELIRVPLIVRASGRWPVGQVVSGSCSLLDLAPTSLELAGIAIPKRLDGRSIDGLALGTESGRPVVAEAARDEKGTYVSVRTATRKGVLETDRRPDPEPKAAFYDLARDPKETSPLSEEETRRALEEDPALGEAWRRLAK